MIKKYLPVIILTTVLVLSPIIFGLVMWDRLPEQVPSHFNSAGEVDGYCSRAMAVFGMPLMMAGAHLLCAMITLADPKRRNIDGKPFSMILWLIPVMSIAVNGVIYAYALGHKINTSTVMLIVLGVVFIVIGNYLPKCGQNYTLGIRTPWALNDTANWTATHRFGGRIFVATGVLTVILALLTTVSAAFFWVTLAIICAASLLPMVYSYVYYVKHPKKED